MRIGFGLSASLCTIPKIYEHIQKLVDLGYEVYPFITYNVLKMDDDPSSGEFIVKKLEEITGHDVISSLKDAERFGPMKPLDLMVICPATGNTISKLANAHTDNAVLMAAKATLRNDKNLVIGVSTNDGLGLNGVNIMKLLSTKNVYFIPFGQDDPIKKHNSLVAHYDMIVETVEAALNNQQIQPLLREYKRG